MQMGDEDGQDWEEDLLKRGRLQSYIMRLRWAVGGRLGCTVV